MWLNPQETADLVTFAEEILSGKLDFLYSCSFFVPLNISSKSLCEFDFVSLTTNIQTSSRSGLIG